MMPRLPLLMLVLAAAGCVTNQKKVEPLSGSWGGGHVGLVLGADGGTLNYDCAAGRIDGPVFPNSIGEFHVEGTHSAGTGGPARVGEEPPPSRALYHGSVKDPTLTLQVIVPSTGLVIGPYTLRKDAAPVLTPCL